MAPKRGVGRGRVRRGRGGRTPRSGHGGRHGVLSMPSSSPLEEGFWRYDFFLRVRGQNATCVLLPSAFSCAFVVKTPLAFFFLLLFPPLLLNVVWMVYFCIFRGAVGLLLMLIWRLTALA